MNALGFVPVGDVVGTFFTNHVYRGYASPRGDIWALFMIDASSINEPAGAWDFVTAFESGKPSQADYRVSAAGTVHFF